MSLFDQAEVKKTDDPKLTLKYICAIMKQIIIFSDYELLQILLSDTYF